SAAVLEAAVTHQAALIATDPRQVAAWLAGASSTFDQARDLDPILAAGISIPDRAPVAVFSSWLAARAPSAPTEHVRAIANLHQMVLEVHRDGDLVQDLMHWYIALGVPVYLGQLGVADGGDEAFLLKMGEELAPRTCASPFATDAAAWQITSLKTWNWGGRHTGRRNGKVIADEMRRESAIQALLPAIRAMPAQRIAVLGHSFTMALNWSSPSAFVPIATEILASENPRVEVRQFQQGGLTAVRAEAIFLAEALAYRPDLAALVCLTKDDADFAALERIIRAFVAQGSRFVVFDDLLVPLEAGTTLERRNRIAKDAGATVVAVGKDLVSSPLRPSFLSLDGIHMRETYHRLMARLWLGFLANRSRAQAVS
ncbi:MAG: hypothetical protein H0W83_10380, partial [Planctomycetes bacterium]|nr:hypothetical protein [Planctomycetota bacterium]